MKDARGIEIEVGQEVIFADQMELERGSWSTMAWGTVIKIMDKMIKVSCNDANRNKAPHNVVVARLPQR